MVWFGGTIPEAVIASKNSSKLFLVYISDNDDISTAMNETWENEDLKSQCQSCCVCLKIEKASNTCLQFSQIYPVVIVPVVYLIGNAGIPLEIIAGHTSANDLIEKIQKAYQVNMSANAQKAVPSATLASSSSTETPTSNEDTPGPSTSSPVPAADASSSSSGALEENEASEEEKRVRAAQLQEKMNRRRLEKLDQEREDERRREIERRELGKNMQEFREQQQLLKRKKELEERRKEKEQEKEALKRVREQIARDRAEKAQRYQQAKTEEVEKRKQVDDEKERAASEAARQDFAEKCKHAKIQYRLPDGSTVLRDYPSETTLAEAIQDLKSQPVALPSFNFRLAMGIPRRVFTAEDEGKTLADLGLPPRASLVVHPYEVAASAPSGPSFFGHVMAFVVLVLNLPLKLVTTVWSGLFGSRPRDSVDSSAANLSHRYPTPENPTPSTSSSTSEGGPRNRSRGNMHRLHDTKKDDDDNATWNGNSTQQM